METTTARSTFLAMTPPVAHSPSARDAHDAPLRKAAHEDSLPQPTSCQSQDSTQAVGMVDLLHPSDIQIRRDDDLAPSVPLPRCWRCEVLNMDVGRSSVPTPYPVSLSIDGTSHATTTFAANRLTKYSALDKLPVHDVLIQTIQTAAVNFQRNCLHAFCCHVRAYWLKS